MVVLTSYVNDLHVGGDQSWEFTNSLHFVRSLLWTRARVPPLPYSHPGSPLFCVHPAASSLPYASLTMVKYPLYIFVCQPCSNSYLAEFSAIMLTPYPNACHMITYGTSHWIAFTIACYSCAYMDGCSSVITSSPMFTPLIDFTRPALLSYPNVSSPVITFTPLPHHLKS